jgi:hypothetical protein
MTSHSDMALNTKSKIPWYAYDVGGVIYAALAGWLLTESSPLAWFCLLSTPVGFFYAWKVWEHDRQLRAEA